MSQLEVDKIIPQSGTTLTIGDSGDTINFADGQNINIDSNTLYIDSTNNRVGIGTSSPDSALNISRDNFNSSIQTVPTNYSLTFFNFGATGEYGNQIGLSNGTNILSSFGFVDEGAGGNTGIYFTTGNSSSQTERLRINNNGNVGIGTTSPSTKLDVEGTGVPIEINSSNSNTYKIQFADNGTVRGYIGSSSGTPIRFANGSASELMRIDSSGRLLVNNTSAEFTNAKIQAVNSSGPTLGIKQTTGTQSAGGFWNSSTDTSVKVISVFKGTSGIEVGTIGVTNSDNLFIQGDSTNSGLQCGTNTILPVQSGANASNTIDMGDASNLWKDIYLGGGLYVGGTGTANKLDDYEEGTFTPTFLGSTTNPTQTYSTRSGIYVKIGKMVHCQIQIYLNNGGITSGSGSALLGGLPFTASASSQGSMGSTYYASNWLTSGGGNGAPIGLWIENNQNRCYLLGNDNYSGSRSGNAAAFITAQSFGNFTFLVGSISYQTDA
jgi:hypothetical protein